MIDIYEYIDYRKLLNDLYEDRKKEFSFFSYRHMAQKVGFSSAGFFINVVQRKRNISSEFIFKFAQLFKMKHAETEYFELLVMFDQAKSHDQKKYYFEKILASKKSKVKVTDAQHYEFYSKWYYTAVREVLNFYRFDGNFAELAKKVSPAITPAEAKKAVTLLEEMGFVKKNERGYYRLVDDIITTGYDAKSLAITNFLISTTELARQAIDRYPRERRSMSSLTFSCSAEGYAQIEERLKRFRREILEIVRSDKDIDRVYHINFHVFPMSNPVVVPKPQ
ncbi:MAG TPA: TIGR02147 family protein [Chitinivibrionales bacterium]|jgi:uncharacterized protein (TIGR02147 family)|nr:TIGR02147 family protein [Chitinivibrionales bacterium]